ncbi:twin-arginine translocase TatA/TatE family subunit [Proteiniclasticum ruminis]|jgi:sec-independent protein translocase protein TatA|uniref:Sec-independent protein translocase protein TatA n=1 Tax=Proteiniclasticum ruminis TaxID=398199 RepID=A0A1I5BUF0_9CLOT|nr:twin-arginine translocase TatA/TatE family subunit [Proteiniclasticum ruminis]SFN78365.1 Sec-independent protein translocase TatA [Proteiniclasticum ruminis]
MGGRFGISELVLILAIALVIFGPSKLPSIGRSIGEAIGEFKSHANKITDEMKLDDQDEKKKES